MASVIQPSRHRRAALSGQHLAGGGLSLRGLDWHDDALCRAIGWPFLELELDEVLPVCRECPVRAECLLQGIAQDLSGPEVTAIYGGLELTDLCRLKRLVEDGDWRHAARRSEKPPAPTAKNVSIAARLGEALAVLATNQPRSIAPAALRAAISALSQISEPDAA